MACSSVNFTGVTLLLGTASSYFDLLRAAGGGRDFPHPSRPDLRPTQTVPWVAGVSRAAEGVWGPHPPSSSAEVKERLELHLYPTNMPAWHGKG
jgi:hypothetical protein